jgi:uncharacterized protein YgbK (DUF1537 family)
MSAPLLGWYGDDFTGATDTLAVLTQAGLRAMLFMGVPGGAQQTAAARALGGTLHAVGIAGASRSMAPAAMEAELEPVGAFFATLGSRVLHYKVCSTFDSAPEVGSIGTAVRVLRRHVRHPFVPIVGGQPNLGRYCAFSNLFAAAGSGGAVERIDRHPTMRNHPMTPMKEADLRRHLSLQGLQPVAGLHYPVYAENQDAQQDVLQRLLDEVPAAVLLDITEPTQLAQIGRLIWQQAQQGALLAVGPSGVAQALIAYWRQSEQMPGAEQHDRGDGQGLARADSPVFIFAGSLSPITARQVRGAKSFQQIALHAGALLDSPSYRTKVQAEIGGHLLEGRHVLAYTASANGEAPDTGKSAELAQATARCVKAIVDGQAVRGAPLRRMAVKALGVWGLSYRAALGAGVCVSTIHSDDPALDGMELMLKGGQMGSEDVFERLLANSFPLTTGSASSPILGMR